MLYPASRQTLQTKPLEHNIERHYDTNVDESIFLQRIFADEDFFDNRLNKCLGIPDLIEVDLWVDNEHGTEDVTEEFEFLHHSTFISFFRSNGVDIPTCFRATRSVRRAVNEVDILKLNNYLTRHGLRAKSWALLSSVVNALTFEYLRGFDFKKKSTVSWRDLYLTMTQLSCRGTSPALYPLHSKELMNFERTLTPIGKHVDTQWLLTQTLIKNIENIEPLFAFYIYRVDKKIFKNTRGKSGKFTFIWKYVTKYKRSHLAMFWLMKELRVRPGRTLRDRLHSLLHNMTFDPKSSWVYRARRFSYNYVYFNCRRTLGETYRTSTK